MQVYSLPAKSKLTYLDAQYFHNAPSRGVTEHVIKIQYRTKHSSKMTEFIIPLSMKVKELNRKARAKLDAEEAQMVIETAKELKKQGRVFGFGFRQVSRTRITDAGGRVVEKLQDAATQCWAYLTESGVEIDLLWGDNLINVKLQMHEHVVNEKQSLAIGYYDSQAALRTFMENRINERQARADSCAASSGGLRTPANDRGGKANCCDSAGSAATVHGSESRSNTVRRDREVGEAVFKGGESQRGSASDALADLGWKSQADSMGVADPKPLAYNANQGQKQPGNAARAVNTRADGGSGKSAVKANGRKRMDCQEFGVWQPEDMGQTSTGLGRTIRIPIGL